jgi:hypothetical protein
MEDLKAIEEYLRNIDPFEISLNRYRSLVNNEESCGRVLHMIARRIYELHGNWINTELQKRNAKSLLVCDKKVIASSKDRYEFSSRYVAQIEDELKKPCYPLSGETLIEEGSS